MAIGSEIRCSEFLRLYSDHIFHVVLQVRSSRHLRLFCFKGIPFEDQLAVWKWNSRMWMSIDACVRHYSAISSKLVVFTDLPCVLVLIPDLHSSVSSALLKTFVSSVLPTFEVR